MRRAAPLAAALALSLAACGTTAPKTICLPLTPYTAEEQLALAAALGALDDGAILARAMADYAKMRDADRACLAAKP